VFDTTGVVVEQVVIEVVYLGSGNCACFVLLRAFVEPELLRELTIEFHCRIAHPAKSSPSGILVVFGAGWHIEHHELRLIARRRIMDIEKVVLASHRWLTVYEGRSLKLTQSTRVERTHVLNGPVMQPNDQNAAVGVCEANQMPGETSRIGSARLTIEPLPLGQGKQCSCSVLGVRIQCDVNVSARHYWKSTGNQ